MKDSHNDKKSPKFQHRQSFRQQLLYEIVRVLRLLPYLILVFSQITVQHPEIRLLVGPTLTMVVVIFVWGMVEYTLRVWTHGLSEPPVTFDWWRIGEDLLTFIGPLAFLALLMFLNHYPW